MNVIADFLEHAPRHGSRVAIIEPGGRSITFAELAARSAAVATAWRKKGIGAGSCVIVAMPVGIDLYVGLAALWGLGAVAVFPEPAMGLKGLRHALAVTQPDACLTGGWYRLLCYVLPEMWRVKTVLTASPAANVETGLADVPPEAPALVSFTSGSTGNPKAIVRSHGFLRAQNAAVAPMLAPKRASETDLVAFPVFVIANLALGITSLLPNWKLTDHASANAADICAYAARHHATRALIPPSICEKLSYHPEELPFAAIFTGGGPVYPDLIESLTQQNPGLELTAVYGSTEAEPIAHISAAEIAPEDWAAMHSGAGLLAGPPADCIRLMIRDDEIIVTGDHVNKGYVDPAQDASTKLTIDGEIWHRTGDAGRLDDKGRLWLLGRLDGRAGGLFPFAVECATRNWLGVERAALVEKDGRALLAIEGNTAHLALWQAEAGRFGVECVPVEKLPLDRRHASKIDYVALRQMLK